MATDKELKYVGHIWWSWWFQTYTWKPKSFKIKPQDWSQHWKMP